MSVKPLSSARDPDLRLSQVAMERAAWRARQVAAQTGTAIVVIRDGVMEMIEPRLMPATDGASEPAAPYALDS